MLKDRILKMIKKHRAFSTRDIYEAFDGKYSFNHLGLGFKTFLFCEVKANNSILTLWDIQSLEKIRQILFNGNGFIVGFSANKKISYSVFKLLPERSVIIYNMEKLKKIGIG